MEEHLSIDLAFDAVHERFVVVAELHPAELALAGLIAGLGCGRFWLAAFLFHGVGDLLQYPKRARLVRSGAAVANLRIVAAAWVTLNDRWRLRERSPYVGRGSSLTALNLDRDDPDTTTRLLLLVRSLLLHALLLLLHHVSMLLLLGRRRGLLIVVLLVDLRRRRWVGDVVVALVDEVVWVGEHRGRGCETTVRVTHGQRRLHVVVLRSWAVVGWWGKSGCRYRRLDRRGLHLDRYDAFLL